MTSKSFNVFRHAGRTTAMLLAIVLTLGSGLRAIDSDDRESEKGLQGTWRIHVTTYNCANGATLGDFHSLLSFARGGTLSGTTGSPLYKPGQRTSDYGVWDHAGANRYKAVSEAFIVFDSDVSSPLPLKAGVQTITQAIEVNGNEFQSVASTQFSNTQGVAGPHLCATAIGERMAIE